MAKKIQTDNSKAGATLPAPLDKPMETFNLNFSGVMDEQEIVRMVHELIERQNALLEVVKRLAVQ